MHIGVDATCWQNQRGYGRHARALLSALVRTDTKNHYTFCLDSTEHTETLPREATVKWVRSAVPTARAASYDGHRSMRALWQTGRALSDPAFDLVLFPTIYSYVPVWSRAKKIVMIHDVIAETFPAWSQPTRTGRMFWNAKTAAGRYQADAIVTVSEFARRGIIEKLKLEPERVSVVGEAADPVFRVLEHPMPNKRMLEAGLNGRFIAYVGGFAPHKNLGVLLDAFIAIANRPNLQDVKLVLVGEYENEVFYSEYPALKTRIAESGLGKRVVFTGYLPDEALVVLLNRATMFVLPSLMEGFGLPAVEAAACGCPVIVSDATPLPALLGDGALSFNPRDLNQLTRALLQILTDDVLRRRLRVQGRAAASRLTWEAAALQLQQILAQFSTS